LRLNQRSIRLSEQKSAAEIAATADDPRYSVLVLRVKGEVSGCAISGCPDDDFRITEYAAADAGLRSHRLGPHLVVCGLWLAAKASADD